jgi:quinol monooxygenase YgiN
MSLIAISARLEIEAGRIDEYLAAAADVIKQTRAEAGCRVYAFARDIQIPNVVWISEECDSDAALSEHLKSPHISAFLKQVADIGLPSLDVRKYTVSVVGTVEHPLAD